MVGVLLPGLCDPEDGVRGGHLQSGLEVGLLVPNSGLVVNEDIIDEGWTGAVVLWRLELELAIQDSSRYNFCNEENIKYFAIGSSHLAADKIKTSHKILILRTSVFCNLRLL